MQFKQYQQQLLKNIDIFSDDFQQASGIVLDDNDPSMQALLQGCLVFSKILESELHAGQRAFYQHMLNRQYPQCLHDIPAMTVLHCQSPRQVITLPRGSCFYSDDGKTVFTSRIEADLLPIKQVHCAVNGKRLICDVDCQPIDTVISIIFMVNENLSDNNLLQMFANGLQAMKIEYDDQSISLSQQHFPQSVCTQLIDHPAAINHFYLCPQQFALWQLHDITLPASISHFRLLFEFTESIYLQHDDQPILHFNVVPAINLHKMACEPIVVEKQDEQYPLRITQPQYHIAYPLCDRWLYIYKKDDNFYVLADKSDSVNNPMLSIDVMVFQPRLLQQFQWKKAQLHCQYPAINAQCLFRPSVPYVHKAIDHQALLSALVHNATQFCSADAVCQLLRVISIQPYSKRYLDSLQNLTFSREFHLVNQQYLEVSLWQIMLRDQDTISACRYVQWLLVLEAFIVLFQPVNLHHQVKVEWQHA